MDPGGSDLEPDLSQLDNPCLIVEDSQPDSAALEEDPDSSYRALLTRRLSSLQPTSHSPVLELISSPAGSRCSQIDSQSAVAQSNRPHSPATMESSSAQEASQVVEVAPPTIRKRDLPAANGRQSEEGMEMESRADSTTHCVQSEGGDCFGFLELSESQTVDGGLDAEAPAAGRGPSLGGAEQSRAEGDAADDQGSASRRSEVSSSCTEGSARSVQEPRNDQGLEPQEVQQPEDDSDVPSSQDDMFEVERGDATGVDSTVPEAGLCLLPTATPASSLHLLHLSGQGTLVQESLSQNSVEFVAPTQDGLSQTPLIVPNSPTDEAVEEPMDTSLPPDEPRSCHREEEPMEMDQAPSQSSGIPRPVPAASTPLSQNSPGFVLEKSLSMPSQPDFSHDVFVPTLSQGDGKSSTGPETLMEKVSPATSKATPSEQEAGIAGRSQPSLCLELPTSSALLEPVPEQEGEQLEDSQATQIEEPLGVVGSVPTVDQQEEAGDPPTRPPNQPDGTTAPATIRPDGKETRRSTDDRAREPPSEANRPDGNETRRSTDDRAREPSSEANRPDGNETRRSTDDRAREPPSEANRPDGNETRRSTDDRAREPPSEANKPDGNETRRSTDDRARESPSEANRPDGKETRRSTDDRARESPSEANRPDGNETRRSTDDRARESPSEANRPDGNETRRSTDGRARESPSEANRPDGKETRRSTDDRAGESPSEANGPDAKVVTETIDLTTAADSQAQDMVCSQNGAASSQEAEVVDLTESEAPVQSPPVAAHRDCGSDTGTQSQSVLPSERPREEKEEDVVMEVQPRSSEACEELGSEASRPEHDEGMDEGEVAKGSGLCLALSQSQVLSPEPMEEDGHLECEEQAAPMEASTSAGEGGCHGSSEVAAEVADESQQNNAVTASRSDEGRPPSESRSPQETRLPENVAEKKPVSTTNGMDGPESSGPRKAATQGVMADGGVTQVSGSGTPSDTSGEIPFHFTLPKEGELIRPVTTATPPLISLLKQTPRHSTPIDMSPFSERLPGDVTAEVAMAASEIMVEESGEDGKNESNLGESEHNGKLSLRMKLVTPVEETSSGSERFSLQKPALSDSEVSVSKVTTVVKAVTSSLPSPSVFSRVCEVRRQAEAPPSEPGTPTRGDLFNSPLSQTGDSERDVPGLLAQKPKSLPRCGAVPEPSRPGDRSPRSQQDGPRPTEAAGGEVREEEPPGTPRGAGGPASPRRPEEGEAPGVETSRTPPGRRAVSQQTSFDASPGLPSRVRALDGGGLGCEGTSGYAPTELPSPLFQLRQRAVSQQTSFETLEPQFPTAQGEPETPPRPSHGQAVRRHIRTIREVRTTVTRIITDVYYENGQEVDRKVTEETEEPLVDCRVVENDVSPSRTGSSMTSGDLADVSSLSSKASSLQHSSSGTSSGGAGPGRQADFVVPMGRGAKSLSPRKMSGQQGAPWGPGASELIEGRGRAQGPRPHTPLTPRGRGRRGRPPSRGALRRAAGNLTKDDAQGSALTSSPEDESYAQVHSRTEDSPGVPDSPGTLSDGAGCASSSSFVGLRVVAKWSSNGYFYSGCITRDSGAGRFRLLFDDRYECDVPGKDILLCDPIPPGTEVTAISDDEYFSTGVVRGHKTEGSDFFYSVEKDGQQRWYGRMAVILSMEQGNRLRDQYGLGPCEPTTPLTKASDISLDNLVEGKRKRRGNVGVNTSPGRSSSDSPRTPGPSGKRKLMASTEEERTPSKRGRRSTGARAGQRGGAFNTSGSGTDLPSDPSDLEGTHGPIPQSASLFLGYAFLLTASSEMDREANQPTSDAEEEYVQTAPYNKRYTETQLEAGGGYILQDFNEQQCSAAYQSILIADQHCRTRKYLLCLASGMPCVSHMWVRDCCHDNQLLNYRSYLLPAGMDPDGSLVEWHSRRNPFKSMKFLLISEEATAFLTDLLNMGGASSVCQYQGDSNNSDPPEGTFNVVLADRSCPPSVQNWAVSVDLPLLSPEWLIQSLICGEKQDHRAQPRYQYDYSP
ncbi:TP53-binding protein 1 isoform X2 [Paramormyrops kingsleyae]